MEEPVTGNWPPLVNREDFIKVQQILEHNPSGFQHNKAEEKRPLTRLLKCNDCGCYLVGYRNNQKDLHYYRCLKCNGVSVNAFTTQRAQRKGANDLFIDFLKQYHLPKELTPLVKLQLITLFEHYNAGQSENDLALKAQLGNIEKKLKHLKIRHGLGEINKETYDLTFDHLNSRIQAINGELNNLTPHISNLEKLISYAVRKLENLSEIWVSSDLENKRRMHKTLFPDGVYYDVKNHEYLTKQVNSFLHLTNYLSNSYSENKNRTSHLDNEKSCLAPPAGLEPATL